MDKKIVCVSSNQWDYLPTRKQIIFEKLALRGYEILYVERAKSLFSPVTHPEFSVKAVLRPRIQKISKNLTLLAPPLLIPGFNRKLVSELNYFLLSRLIKRWIHRNGYDDYILWTYVPEIVDQIKYLNPSLVVYDCTDEHASFEGAGSFLIEKEEKLCRISDLVFVTAKGMLETKGAWNKNTIYAPNGVDFERFQKCYREESPMPSDIAQIPRPIIGFVGSVSAWIDLELVELTAAEMKKCSFVFVGPVTQKEKSSFSSLPNVHLLGRKENALIPQYIKSFDVCLNPFKMNNLAKFVNPLKVYEYLALGKPVVSSAMPEVILLGDAVFIVPDRTVASFKNCILDALGESSSAAKAEKRISIARQFDWDSVFKMMFVELENCMNLKTGSSR